MSYDGTTKIGDELAKLYKFSPNSDVKIAKVMKEARAALNLGNGKRLTPEQNMAIWHYHHNKVNGVNIPTEAQGDIVEYVEYVNNPMDKPPSDVIIPTKPLKPFTKATEGAFKLINFSVKLGTKRTVISLEQYIVDALKDRFALMDNSAVRQWIEAAMVDSFEGNEPIMRQVRFTIFQALVGRLKNEQ